MPRKANASRTTARETGAARYQGAPCAKGHDGRRYTSTGACVTCQAQHKARWYGRPVVEPERDEFDAALG